jgi:hypothetical protein
MASAAPSRCGGEGGPLIELGNEALRLAAGLPVRSGPDLIMWAQDAIVDLDTVLGRLMQSRCNLKCMFPSIGGLLLALPMEVMRSCPLKALGLRGAASKTA